MRNATKLLIIAGLFILVSSYFFGGRFVVVASSAHGTAYIVDRVTGNVRFCDEWRCWDAGMIERPVPLSR